MKANPVSEINNLVELQRLDKDISVLFRDVFEAEEAESEKTSEKKILKKLDGMRKTRTGMTRGIDTVVLKRYERLRGNKGESAGVVPVLKNVCQGCFIEVSTATVAELQRRSVAATCDHCGRFIFFQSPS